MKKLTLFLTIPLLVFPLLACNQSGPQKPAAKAEAKTEHKAEQPAATPTAAKETAPAGVSGKVIETMDAAGYTYVYVDDGHQKIWAAAPEFSVKVGDEVMVPEGMAMKNYHSQTLNRDFETVYFVDSVLNASNPTMGHSSAMGGAMGGSGDMKIPAGHPAITGSKAPESVDLTAIEKADGGMTIGEIYAAKTDLSGKPIILRAKVVKFSPQIMGTNWLHLQDGSGDLKAGTHDLTVTSNTRVKIGDTVVVKGTLTLDKDFGYGYKYDLIMENADVSVE